MEETENKTRATYTLDPDVEAFVTRLAAMRMLETGKGSKSSEVNRILRLAMEREQRKQAALVPQT